MAEELHIPKIRIVDVIRYVFPIAMMIVFWILVHLLTNSISTSEMVSGFLDFILQVGAMFSTYLFSKLFIEWVLKKFV